LTVVGAEDLQRDILKSESCVLSAPELQLEVQPGTLGGRFTTVEGLLTQIRDDLKSTALLDGDEVGVNTREGDSGEAVKVSHWKKFFTKLDDAILGLQPFRMILEDPMAASYVQKIFPEGSDPKDAVDDQIEIEDYERTAEEDDDLGLADMNVEEYKQKEGKEDEKKAKEEDTKEDKKEDLADKLGDVKLDDKADPKPAS
jgi:zinc finger protein